MAEQSMGQGIELLCVIVDDSLASKVLHIAKEAGVTGGTIFLGRGTIRNRFLKFLALTDVRKEIVLMIVDSSKIDHIVSYLDKEFRFDKPNHGIAFTISITNVIGAKNLKVDHIPLYEGVENTLYQVITTIVDRGNAEFVIEAATKAGSRGGTIVHGRGSGIHETQKLFSMEIEPEKEIVIILSETETTGAIVESIRQELNIDEPGKGIIYVQPVNQTFGLYKEK